MQQSESPAEKALIKPFKRCPKDLKMGDAWERERVKGGQDSPWGEGRGEGRTGEGAAAPSLSTSQMPPASS